MYYTNDGVSFYQGDIQINDREATDSEVLAYELLRDTEQLEAEAKGTRDKAMLKGFLYQDKDISVTKDDGDGMVQVKMGFEMGLTSTVIHFKNGTKLPMLATDFSTFAQLFLIERDKFFGGI